MAADEMESLVRFGLATWLAVSVFRWMLGQLGVALCGYRKIISELSWVLVGPLFIVCPQLLALFFFAMFSGRNKSTVGDDSSARLSNKI